MSNPDPIRNTIDDLAYVRRLREENDNLRRQLGAYQALIAPPPEPPPPGPIATRWQDVRWRATIERDGGYLVAARLYNDAGGYPIFDLDEPSAAEAAALQLAAQAPSDIRALLDVLRAYERLQNVGRQLIERWTETREATPLDLELAALAVQLRPSAAQRRADIARGVGELFEDEPPGGIG